MNTFFLNMRHYFKRLMRDLKEIVLLIIIPVGLTVIWSMFGDPVMVDGYNVISSMNAAALMLSFQFFNMAIMLSLLYHDFRGDMRWRLRAAPKSLTEYVLPAFAASWLFSIFLGVLILAISVLFLNAYLGNLLVLAAVLLLVSLMATLISMLIFLFTKTYNAANGVVYIVSFGLMTLSGYMIPLGSSAAAQFLNTHGTPLALGVRAVMYGMPFRELIPGVDASMGLADAWFNIGILAAITLVIAVITLVAARRRKI